MARRIELTAETWHALDDLSCDTGRPIHELAEEAIADLLKKNRRPRSLREALEQAFGDDAAHRREQHECTSRR